MIKLINIIDLNKHHSRHQAKDIIMQIGFFLLPVLIAISLAQGCSFSASSTSSESSESSSDSSGSSSDSSGSSISSSSSSEQDKDYENEIMDYTTAYLSTAEFDRFAFLKGISEIAIANGITSWEDDEVTFIGIGRGLRKSRMTGSVYQTYKKSIADSSETRMQFIQQGYDMQ